MTATLGRSAPVAIVVAIALAVSWKPLVKSKLSAAATTSTTMTSPALIAGGRSNAWLGLCSSASRDRIGAARRWLEGPLGYRRRRARPLEHGATLGGKAPALIARMA